MRGNNYGQRNENYSARPSVERDKVDRGRYPVNVLHDGSEEVTDELGINTKAFFCARATDAERAGSRHPTVKPLALMRRLVKLACPPGGITLDMFAGTGTTLEATVIEGRLAIGIEADNEYWPDIELRLERAHAAYVVDGVAVPAGASTGAPVAQDADDKLTQAAGSTAANGDSGTSSDRLYLDASASELDSVSPQRGEDAAGASNYEASLVSHCADESGTVGLGAQPGAASPPLVTHEAGDDSDNVYALTDTSALDDRQDAATQGIKEKRRIHLGARGEQSTSEVQARPACNDASGEAAPLEPATDPEGDGIMPTDFRRKEGWLEGPSLVVTVP